jgi:hypothetical protein
MLLRRGGIFLLGLKLEMNASLPPAAARCHCFTEQLLIQIKALNKGKTVGMYTLNSRSCRNTLPMFLLFDYLEFLRVLKCLLEHLNNSNSVRIPR